MQRNILRLAKLKAQGDKYVLPLTNSKLMIDPQQQIKSTFKGKVYEESGVLINGNTKWGQLIGSPFILHFDQWSRYKVYSDTFELVTVEEPDFFLAKQIMGSV